MLETHVVRIAPDGTVQFIDKPVMAPLKAQGPAVLRRASHVEPAAAVLRWAFHLLRRAFGEAGAAAAFTRAWPCRWRVNLSPSGGPVLSKRYRDRGKAIDAEVAWLQAGRLGSAPAAGPTADISPEAPTEPARDTPEALASVVTEYLDRLDLAGTASTLEDAVRLTTAISESDRDELVRAARAAHAEPVLLTRAEIEAVLAALDPWGRFRAVPVLRPAEMSDLCARLRRVGACRLAAKLTG